MLEFKNSMILTGNNLGMLANVDALPTEDEVNKFIKASDSQPFKA